MPKYLAGFGVGILAWVLFAVFGLKVDEGTVQRLANVGEGLAPIGSILTTAALLFAYDQFRDGQRMAHLDRLADAYAAWASVARHAFSDMLLHVHELSGLVDETASNLSDPAKRDRVTTLVIDIHKRHREIIATGERIVLLDRDASAIEDLKAIFGFLGDPPAMTGKGAQQAVENFEAEIKRRSELMVHVLDDVRKRIQAG